MPAPRQPQDPWYTVLYRDPHTYWWAPGLVIFAGVLAFTYLVLGESLPQAFLGPTAGATGTTVGIAARRRGRGRPLFASPSSGRATTDS